MPAPFVTELLKLDFFSIDVAKVGPENRADFKRAERARPLKVRRRLARVGGRDGRDGGAQARGRAREATAFRGRIDRRQSR